ncbi:hypothetical protein AA0242T_1321 [Acetobacter aceti NRIC 0242]|uniref:EAL domain-containing protein n=1 Tax=Acetobacter aceti NBRC 14818 TaxID=887700 RepID=A0AB33IIE6_ACEAC|nr:EAL domain-containing protein [Acetobacter aceti]TCS33135.1 EAL domain-containing protein (putative c-di-GMP-specific phosphodiesterase class I) [Acetobacter aceti NBRC 14818]BCK75807.1 hypothetical protein EMQ_1413 [Acetobacter aceti NBRC 14818]GAN57986.1 diguanylate cyclase/phosphodiesterase [Acetobacter aceti NBRC 14818]GBO80619.1 hypothetical protein AA0242T_1321 [Acetobacter aceti NRIC 0242]
MPVIPVSGPPETTHRTTSHLTGTHTRQKTEASFSILPRFSLSTLAVAGGDLCPPPTFSTGRTTLRRRHKEPVWLPLISEGCRIAAKFPPDCRLALPVEAADTFPDDLLTHLASLLSDNQLETSRLDFEFTETSLAIDNEILIYSLAALRDAGAGLVLSGFGTGLTSLSLLRDRSFSGLLTAVKLDRHLFCHDDPAHLQAGQSIARAVVQLGSDFGLNTRAEGVDTPETLHFLQSIGCQEGRGNCLGKPQSLTDFLKDLKPARSGVKKRKRTS